MEEASRQRKERLEALKKRKLAFEEASETLEKQADKITKEVKATEEIKRTEEVDLFNLAPKKPNWDLKRDVEKKLARLDRKTQASIAKLIRMRLQSESADDATVDLADAVNAQQKADSDDDDSD
ncbi:303_t:CDS:2 [Acaulospora colombiana]|uniref:303_t:CDS:1 n=1 Tax=Acaulospora colombiana TaxID=27376 RepID=A0ACA9PLV9_9GLOM|nr:303_t:CDS:2 [Acaulospora colombiana]